MKKNRNYLLKNKIYFLALLLLLTSISTLAQEQKKLIITGKILDKMNKQALEYATITFKNTKNPKLLFGGITNNKGEFSVEIVSGNYDIIAEFISFKPFEIKEKQLVTATNLGTIILDDENINELSEVIVRSEKTTVEIKLDKKVYNVGKDLMVKGGTVSDVLDNIPSVAVDVEGNISLRGNENVRVLIDGRPSNVNLQETLRSLPADAIDKVEVITNPSARYDAEGGAGILNIILKKGKNQGVNGTLLLSTADPESYGGSTTLNFKSKKFNLFTTQGYNYRNNPGNAKVDSRYLNEDTNDTESYLFERRKNERLNKSYNGSFGFDWLVDKSTTWTNAVNYQRSSNVNKDNVNQDFYDQNLVFVKTRNRLNDELGKSENIEFTTNFVKKFKRDGHKLTIDGAFSSNTDESTALITETNPITSTTTIDATLNNQKQNRNLIQTDYILPFGKSSQLEMGYRGNFLDITTDFAVNQNGNPIDRFTNILEYKEKVHALYTQYGVKVKSISILLGMRWEDSDIDINQLATSEFNNKRYANFFPSAFFTYEFKDKSSASLSYSKRINRPRGRQLNPFNNFSSNVNIFVGNPDLNPAFTDAFELGYMKRWNKLTINTMVYFNITSDFFQQIRSPNGEVVNGVPVYITQPINLNKEYRAGIEFTLNYTPYKWWKLNGNVNIFRNETDGNYTLTTPQNENLYQDFINASWTSKLNSKINLPYKIDWQTNMTYNAFQKNVQGNTLGVFSFNLAFSKDVFKERATIALNVNDVLNSRKRMMETYIPNRIDSYAEMQWRVRQITASFTYRFNVQKNEKEKQPKRSTSDGNDGGEF